ncbi:hypothetical protein LY78DRAFT_654945 [Colletotrichum sublineola]|nr:hypothetical protein LY78DRAFT_654945 [Colletotrichum sublineola]
MPSFIVQPRHLSLLSRGIASCFRRWSIPRDSDTTLTDYHSSFASQGVIVLHHAPPSLSRIHVQSTAASSRFLYDPPESQRHIIACPS